MDANLQTLKTLVWDYNVAPEDVYDVLLGKRERVFHLTREKVFIRVLERLTWYKILELLPLETVRDLLTEDVISQLRCESMRKEYDYARRLLHGLPLPASRWRDRGDEAARNPLLYYRRYRP